MEEISTISPITIASEVNDKSLEPNTNWSSSSNNGVGKNGNIYWFAATGLAVWFLFVHTPPLLIQRKVFQHDPLLVLHLLGAGGIYLACVHNALFTPSTFQGRSLPWHIWVGRAGMILGILGFLTGAILSWTRLDSVGLSFAIPITIGGLGQVLAQWRGYHFIQLYRKAKDEELALAYMYGQDESKLIELQQQQKTYLSYHIGYMIGVFVAACGIPAVLRVFSNVENVWPLIAAYVGFNVMSSAYANTFISRIDSRPPRKETATDETRLI